MPNALPPAVVVIVITTLLLAAEGIQSADGAVLLAFIVMIELPSLVVNVVLRDPLAPATNPEIVTVPGPLPSWITPVESGTPMPFVELTSCVMYTPLVKFVTVTGTEVAVPVCVTLVPPAPFTVTLAFILIVQVDVVPDVGGPNWTRGLAVVPLDITVAVLALAPGVNVQL